MRSLAISSVAVAALMVAQPAFAGIDSGVGAPPVAPPTSMGDADNRVMTPGNPDDRMGVPDRAVVGQPMRRMSPAISYARPGYGFQLPREWMSPQYAVDGHDFGLGRPAPGFGWSRYYDNLVLTDQWGRVYDVAEPNGRGGYDDRGGHGGRRFGSRATDGIAGGVAGAAVGAVAGNLIAGHGSRLAGSLIGGGVGALVGLGVEALIVKKGRKRSNGADYDDGHHSGHGGGYGRGGYGHWGGAPAYGYGYSYGGSYGGGSEVITTTTTTTHHGGGGGYLVPRQVVTYENVYAPVRTKYVRRAAPTKYRVREEAPVTTGKVRERTKLHTRTY